MRPELERVLRTCLDVAREEAVVREAMREALDAGDDAAVVEAARRLLGLAGDRTAARVERGAGRA